MNFELKRISQEILDSTAVSWYASADSLGIPQIDSEKIISWSERHIDYEGKTNTSAAYGIFQIDMPTEAVAIVDVVYSEVVPKHGWLKVLNISLSPVYCASEVEADIEKLYIVVDIYVASVIGGIELTDDHKAKVLKIFGRNEGLFNLLVILKERLSAVKDSHIAAKIEGRWLVITTK
jgi:hypothetical protein